jgi:GTP-binding protein YchF
MKAALAWLLPVQLSMLLCRSRAWVAPLQGQGLGLGLRQATVPGYRRYAPHMKLTTGLVGMPNVGKSTLANALSGSQAAQAANFPFCTVEPNAAQVAVPDARLDVLGKINNSRKTIPTSLEFLDIAGLVKGASKGEGLGNKFLANIRECDAIVHVVRCFEDPDIIHVEGGVDAVRDVETINLELALADLAQVEKRASRIKRDKEAKKEEHSALEKLITALDEGRPARLAGLDDEELKTVKALGLLTAKPVIYALNVADSDLATGNEQSKKVADLAVEEGSRSVLVSAQVECELVELDGPDRLDFLEALGVSEENCGLKALIREAYSLLGLRTYFTSGETETRAWTIPAGCKAPQAAGVIHSDFGMFSPPVQKYSISGTMNSDFYISTLSERGFIRAECVGYDDLVKCGSEKAAKEAGLWRSEGKEYTVNEGDILLFRFNV